MVFRPTKVRPHVESMQEGSNRRISKCSCLKRMATLARAVFADGGVERAVFAQVRSDDEKRRVKRHTRRLDHRNVHFGPVKLRRVCQGPEDQIKDNTPPAFGRLFIFPRGPDQVPRFRRSNSFNRFAQRVPYPATQLLQHDIAIGQCRFFHEGKHLVGELATPPHKSFFHNLHADPV
ncbi:hypothetical protein SAMN05421750_11387 [Agrobacterium pusense]|nr:hypothetical protein SAMN05421750_11387 [Agrobacterium pusense]